ncbi:transposase [bacterium]|nr:transposase [bacterium]
MLVDEKLNCVLETEPYERTGTRKGYRNCRRSRTLKTWTGSLEPLASRDREGHFQTELFERYHSQGPRGHRGPLRHRVLYIPVLSAYPAAG